MDSPGVSLLLMVYMPLFGPAGIHASDSQSLNMLPKRGQSVRVGPAGVTAVAAIVPKRRGYRAVQSRVPALKAAARP